MDNTWVTRRRRHDPKNSGGVCSGAGVPSPNDPNPPAQNHGAFRPAHVRGRPPPEALRKLQRFSVLWTCHVPPPPVSSRPTAARQTPRGESPHPSDTVVPVPSTQHLPFAERPQQAPRHLGCAPIRGVREDDRPGEPGSVDPEHPPRIRSRAEDLDSPLAGQAQEGPRQPVLDLSLRSVAGRDLALDADALCQPTCEAHLSHRRK